MSCHCGFKTAPNKEFCCFFCSKKKGSHGPMCLNFGKHKLNQLISIPSDINEHLPTLTYYAEKCDSVLELGIRGCISSWAFLEGLNNNKNSCQKRMFLCDITPCNIVNFTDHAKKLNIDVNYQFINDLELNLKETFDITFIDTWHIYGQLIRELNKFHSITNKYMILHDTEVDKYSGESIRCNSNIEEQSLDSGYPVHEIKCGLEKAINEFLLNNPNWIIEKRYTNNNGLTILKKI